MLKLFPTIVLWQESILPTHLNSGFATLLTVTDNFSMSCFNHIFIVLPVLMNHQPCPKVHEVASWFINLNYSDKVFLSTELRIFWWKEKTCWQTIAMHWLHRRPDPPPPHPSSWRFPFAICFNYLTPPMHSTPLLLFFMSQINNPMVKTDQA